MKTVWQSLLLSTLNCIISARRSPQRADGSSQSELWLNPGGLQEGDLMGEERAQRPRDVGAMQSFRWLLSSMSSAVTGWEGAGDPCA